MVEGLDESLRRRVETLSKKMTQRIQQQMVLVLKMAVRWCVYDVVRSLCFSRGDVGWGLMRCALNCLLARAISYDIGLLLCVEFYSLGQNG